MAAKVPTIKVARVNLKPILGKGTEGQLLDVQRVLKKVQREIRKSIKKRIEDESAFSRRAKIRLAKAMRIVVGGNSVTVTTKDPAFKPLMDGQKPGQMTWLTKAKRPIPIVTDEGNLIFRSATPRSMANGSWYHPGRKKTTVLQKARKEAREKTKKFVVSELKKRLVRSR